MRIQNKDEKRLKGIDEDLESTQLMKKRFRIAREGKKRIKKKPRKTLFNLIFKMSIAAGLLFFIVGLFLKRQ